MARYEWERGYRWEYGPRRPRGGYGRSYGAEGGAPDRFPRPGGMNLGMGGGWESWGPGGVRGYDRGFGRGPDSGYDRGTYGGSYPGYGGLPGGAQRGIHYGGRPGGYGAEYSGPGGGWNRGYEGYARAPFVPEEAYRRHPELDRAPHPQSGRWAVEGGSYDSGVRMEDDEIAQAVRQNLHQDNWVPAARVEVDVNGGVVTLTGEVDDYMQARYAWDDAWETEGVRGVVNHLTVRTDQPQATHGDPLPQTSGGKKSGKK